MGTITGSAARAAAAPRLRSAERWLPPVLLYGSVLAVLLVVSWQTVSRGVENPLGLPGLQFAGDGFWGGWVRMDGGWYVGIAESGYSYVPGQQSSVAFFPGYPLVVRTVGRAIGNVPLGGIVVTVACGLAAHVLFWRWCLARVPRSAAIVALAVLALYPYAWYLYGAVYGDALFLVAVLGAFALLEHGRPVLAGLVGAGATATRFVGIALVVGLVLGALERRGAFDGPTRWRLPRQGHLRRLRAADAGVLLSLLGLLGWVLWLWRRFGDPLLFSSVQAAWGQPASPRTWFKLDFGSQLLRGTDRTYAYGLLLQGLLAFGVVLLLPAVLRRFGLRYAAYTAVLVAIPLVGSQDFQGVGRYLIAAFPAFAVVGSWLAEHRVWAKVALPVSGALLLLGTTLFAHGLYLA